MNLLSDAAQSETWPAIKPQLTKGKVRTKWTLNTRASSASPFADTLSTCRPSISLTVSPPSSRTRPRSRSLRISTSSSSLPRALAVPSVLSSVRAVVSTLPLPSTKMSPARPRRRLSLSVSPSALVTSTRPLSRRRSTLTFTVSVVA